MFSERFLLRADFWFRIWYRIVGLLDRKGQVVFMNYGFSDNGSRIELQPEEEHNRYSIQLYHHLTQHIDIDHKKVLEIGCGRGGGLAFLTKKFGPAEALGVDLDKLAVKFCNRKHGHQSLRFIQGDAQKLALEDNSADCIINVESSHRYPKFDQFLQEVHRVLKPGGSFLFTDFRFQSSLEEFFKSLELSRLVKIHETDITERVVEALDLDDARKRKLINSLSFWPISKIALEFAAVRGSGPHQSFSTGQWKYYSFHLMKPEK